MQTPSVRSVRRMGSRDRCEKGYLPKRRESHVLHAGSAVEKTQDCHIGNYMEGYLTQWNGLIKKSFLQQQRTLVVVFLFAVTSEWP
ncbi:hypothetical protein JOC33_002510 [Thalassobacillus pellis]|nr:hypothetical protein [Thalassobacillus pellis]